jgi:hypothetical protein
VMQVIAKGFKTYGSDYKIDKPEMTFEVRLKRPGQQYSIYEKHPEAADSSNGAGKDKPSDAGKDVVPKDSGKKDSSKDQPAESANQSGTKPDSSQPQPQ